MPLYFKLCTFYGTVSPSIASETLDTISFHSVFLKYTLYLESQKKTDMNDFLAVKKNLGREFVYLFIYLYQ